ncbi:MAG: WYL domain-containing protein [Anaerolineales bacterium]|nr:WYL domain-containing protein [Anaerolineales bacterium]
MNRLDRLFGIWLLLRGGAPVAAGDLARRFEVSRRTIYRDVETLSALGAPVFARRGHAGGLQLLDGYFLPPLMLTAGEAVSLLLGLTLLSSLRAKPFAAELATAEQKLLAAVPEALRAALSQAAAIVGFETPSPDLFHPEPAPAGEQAPHAPPEAATSQAVTTFLQAILDRRQVMLEYQGLSQSAPQAYTVAPAGVFWDRERWYLVGRRPGPAEATRLFRADRTRAVRPGQHLDPAASAFDVRDLLGHRWMQAAMAEWRRQAPVRLRLTADQAERLRRDWYYRQAEFASEAGGTVLMTYGEDDQAAVLALLRWLGPGAELLDPRAWRRAARHELEAMLRQYAAGA